MKIRLAMATDLALRSVQLKLAIAMAMAMAMAMVLVRMKVRLLPTMGKGLLKIGSRSSAQKQDQLVLM